MECFLERQVRMKIQKGFTLIELLVVISIIALLLSILTPSLQMAKEHARRMLCSTNLKTFGTAMYLYSEEYNDKMIPNASYNGKEFTDGIYGPGEKGSTTGYQNWQSYITGLDMGDPLNLKALQLGKLFSLGYVEEFEIYYCPTASRTLKGDPMDEVIPKSVKSYTTNVIKHMPPGQSGWGVPVGQERCNSNYMYWTWEKTSILDVSLRPLVFDTMLTVAHQKGDNPYGVNALFGDGHVNMTLFSGDPEILAFIEESRDWTTKASDYEGFVNVLRRFDP